MKYLLDTNICIFFLRGKFDIHQIIKKIGINNCVISEITVAELLYGVECANDSAKERRLVEDFCSYLKVVPISECLKDFAFQKSKLRKEGRLIDDLDLLIGVTALHYKFILVTDNINHFNRLPITIENWVNR